MRAAVDMWITLSVVRTSFGGLDCSNPQPYGRMTKHRMAVSGNPYGVTPISTGV